MRVEAGGALWSAAALCAAALLGAIGCQGVDPIEGLGAEGEECLADADCREGLLCLEGGSCGRVGPNWPVAGDPLELPAPEGVYEVFDLVATNSNGATRRLTPFIERALEGKRARLFVIFRREVSGLPFELMVGSATGELPFGLTFFEGRLRPRALSGASIEVTREGLALATASTPPFREPEEGFYVALVGEDFSITVPIAAALVTGQVTGSQGVERLDLSVEGAIVRRVAREVEIEAEGVGQTLEDFLGPQTQDLDIDRDALLDGWSVRLSISAARVSPSAP